MSDQERRNSPYNNLDRLYSISVDAGKRLLDKATPENFIGGGLEKDIYDLGNDRMVAFFPRAFMDKEGLIAMMKTHFYTTKLMHTLLPKNVPQMHFAGGLPPAAIIERVTGSVIGDDHNDEIDSFIDRLSQMGLERVVDTKASNYMCDEQGNLVYLDLFNPSVFINNGKFEEYLETLEEPTRNKANKLLQKISVHSSGLYW